MILSRWIFIYVVIVMFSGLSMASGDAGIDENMVELFEIGWESMRYNKTVTQYNPEVSSNRQPSRADENLTLNCQIEIEDPNLIIGISRKGFLTGITDGDSQNIEIDQGPPAVRRSPMSRSFEMRYEGLRYHRRFTQPPKVPSWRAYLRKFLGIQQPPFTPQLVNQLEPPRIQFDLDLGLLEGSGGEIRSLKGYYYALAAESVEHVEVPFEPNEQWVRLTDDVAIQVRQAKCTISGTRTRYNYEIEESRTAGRRGIDRLSVGDYLPQKMVMGRQFIKQDGEPHDRSMGPGFMPAHVGGSGSGTHSGSGGPGGPIEKIRFLIAINPKHCKIPFELKNIPLPNPESKDEQE